METAPYGLQPAWMAHYLHKRWSFKGSSVIGKERDIEVQVETTRSIGDAAIYYASHYALHRVMLTPKRAAPAAQG